MDQTRRNLTFIKEDINKLPMGQFFLFSFGSNSIEQLSNRLNVEYDQLRNSSFPVSLKGYQRGFFSYSIGRKGSVATIFPKTNSTVFGIAIKLQKKRDGLEGIYLNNQKVDFVNLCKNEAVQYNKYRITKIPDLKYKNQMLSPCYTFLGNLNHIPNGNRDEQEPSNDYLKSISKMLMERRSLLNQQNRRSISIDIFVYSRARNIWIDKGCKIINLDINNVSNCDFNLSNIKVKINGNNTVCSDIRNTNKTYTYYEHNLETGLTKKLRTQPQRIDIFCEIN